MAPQLTPRQSVRRGLNVAGLPSEGLMSFDFKPSIGIAAAQIDKLGLDIRSFREPLKRVVQRVMAPSFRENFDQEGRPDPWPEPSPATLDIREKAGIGGDMSLDRTGLLKKTIQQLNIWTITQKNATIQSLPSKVWYGKIHQEGYEGSGGGRSMKQYIKAAGGDAKLAFQQQTDDLNTAQRTGQKAHGGTRNVSEIPQRMFVLVQEEDMDAIEEVFVEWLTERVVRAGFKRGVG
jgi:phage gpG-like protein